MSDERDEPSIEARLDETIDRLEEYLAAFIEQAGQTTDGDDDA